MAELFGAGHVKCPGLESNVGNGNADAGILPVCPLKPADPGNKAAGRYVLGECGFNR